MGRAAPPALPAGKASLGKAQAGAGGATPLGAAPSIAGLWHRHQHNPTPRPAGRQGKQQWSLGSPEKAMGARGHDRDPGSPGGDSAATMGRAALVHAASKNQDERTVCLRGGSSHPQAKQGTRAPRFSCSPQFTSSAGRLIDPHLPPIIERRLFQYAIDP